MTIFIYSSETGYKRTREDDLPVENKLQKTDRFSPTEYKRIEQACDILSNAPTSSPEALIEAHIVMAEAHKIGGMKSQRKKHLATALAILESVQDPHVDQIFIRLKQELAT